jgi:hypothetical protein
MLRIAASIVLAAALLPAALADERIEGAVRGTHVTYCDAPKLGSCAGTLTIERRSGSRVETLSIRVPFGTPISRACDIVPLQTLEGKTVIVTGFTEGSVRVAKAIEVQEEAADC